MDLGDESYEKEQCKNAGNIDKTTGGWTDTSPCSKNSKTAIIGVQRGKCPAVCAAAKPVEAGGCANLQAAPNKIDFMCGGSTSGSSP